MSTWADALPVRSASAGESPWLVDGRLTSTARRAIELLGRAHEDGLDRSDYLPDWVIDVAGRTADADALPEETVGAIDSVLTAAATRYHSDLNFGRVPPHELGARYRAAGPASADLLNAWPGSEGASGDPPRGRLATFPQYQGLRVALARYREIATHDAWQRRLLGPAGGRLSKGQRYDDIQLLLTRLALLGDIAHPTAAGGRYQGPAVEAVRSFQRRHGISPDGVIGQQTLAQLEVSPRMRVRQIELALERLRWTPLWQAPRGIVVNVPEFSLQAYELTDGALATRLAMKVVVGTAGKTQTPLFDAEMRFIEFSPYWNVPPSIARGETLPRLRRDPGHFERNGFEFVAANGQVITAFSEASLKAVEHGQMRIRQRPGPANALGDIKFVFPNDDNIYLHHTPQTQLFKRDRRDFSHGCIRVEAPVELAKFVLAKEQGWTEQRIVDAMRRGKSTTIRLPEGLPVIIAYNTVVVDDGRIHFFPDIYGYDAALDSALRQRRPLQGSSGKSEMTVKSLN